MKLYIFGNFLFKAIFLIGITSLYGCMTLYSEVPDEWDLKTVYSNGNIKKSIFIDYPLLGDTTGISKKKVNQNNKNEIVVAGRMGAIYLINGRIEKEIYFHKANVKKTIRASEPVYYEDQEKGFFYDQSGYTDLAIYDENGLEQWVFDEGTWAKMIAGDVNGDGLAELLVSTRNEIKLLDKEKQLLWKKNDEFISYTNISDIDGNGVEDIIHNAGDLRIRVRDMNGNIVNYIENEYLNSFSTGHWPTSDSPIRIIGARENLIVIENNLGKSIKLLDAPMVNDRPIRVGLVNFDSSGQSYLIVNVLVRATWGRSLLYIFSSDGELVYQEIIPSSYVSLLTVDNPVNNTENLLVGVDDGKVFMYEFGIKKGMGDK